MTQAPPGTVATVQFPAYADWIPDPDRPLNVLATLLAVCEGVLEAYGMGDAFPRRVYTHGEVTPLHLPDTKQGQLVVTMLRLEQGRPGEKQYKTDEGALGRYGFQTGQYRVFCVVPWPTPQGGLAPKLADDADLQAATGTALRAMNLVTSALRSVALGGTKTNPPMGPGAQDHMLLGPASPWGPQGGYAGWEVAVEVAFSG
jgi:hypothetical protein